MIKAQRMGIGAIAAALLGGCATGNGEAPLVFGSSNVAGISMGGNVADTGGEFVFGYKGNNFAVVPVSAMTAGEEQFLGSALPDGTFRNSYSVIGHFSANARKEDKGANAGLGKFFATGIAAQTLAIGFSQKLGVDRTQVAACKQGEPAVQEKAARQERARQARNAFAGSPAQPDAARSGARLIFAQQDIRALAVDGSAVESGLKFTLGYRDRNLALIPVVGRDAQGRLVSLEGSNPEGGNDVLSVLGQFHSRDEVNGAAIASGLHTFFSTGAAANYLATGFQTQLCEEYTAPKGGEPPKGDTQRTASTR